MSQAPKDIRSAAEKARDTAADRREPEERRRLCADVEKRKPLHQRVARGEITEQKKPYGIFRKHALKGDEKREDIASVRESARVPLITEERARVAWAARSPATGRKGKKIETELKTPLDERALDRLTLGTDAAVISYQEQRLKLDAARKARHNRQRADLAQTQSSGHDEIA